MMHSLKIRLMTVPALFMAYTAMGQLWTPAPTTSGTDVRVGATTQYFGAKLSVTGAANTGNDWATVLSMNNSDGQNIGLQSSVGTNNAASSGYNYGLWSEAGNQSNLSTTSCGVRSVGENGGAGGTYGLLATANSRVSGSGGRTIGVRAEAYLATTGSNLWIDGMSARALIENGATGWTVFGSESDVVLNSGSSVLIATGATGTVSGAGAVMGTGALAYGLLGDVSGGSAPVAYGCSGTVSSASTTAYGLFGRTTSGATRYGVYGEATSAGTYTRLYGVFGKAPMVQSVPVTNWATVTSWAGYFDGHVQVVGSFTSGSDRKLKKDIEPLKGALGLLERLAPKTYFFDADKYPSMSLPREHQFGLIAQEAQEVVPDLVLHATHPEQLDAKGQVVHPAVDYLTMNYQGLIPVLIGGIQEQQAQIASQKEEIDGLKDRLAELEKALKPAGGDGSTREGALFQNEPNPFSENTVIRYALGSMTGKAAIDIIGGNGQVVKRFTGLGMGNGQLLIGAGSLPAGTYTYVLSVDGQQLDAKKMVITH